MIAPHRTLREGADGAFVRLDQAAATRRRRPAGKTGGRPRRKVAIPPAEWQPFCTDRCQQS